MPGRGPRSFGMPGSLSGSTAIDGRLGASLDMTVVDTEEDAEARLVRRALEGDHDAWGSLVRRHDRRVMVVLLARGVRFDRARDLAQEAWTRLWTRQRAGKLVRLELPGLAIAQALYLAMDECRATRDEVPFEGEPMLLVDPLPSVESRLVSRTDLARAAAELRRCSPTAQRIFELVYEEPSVPHRTIAADVKLSVQRVRQTLCEVRSRLRSAMSESNETEGTAR